MFINDILDAAIQSGFGDVVLKEGYPAAALNDRATAYSQIRGHHGALTGEFLNEAIRELVQSKGLYTTPKGLEFHHNRGDVGYIVKTADGYVKLTRIPK